MNTRFNLIKNAVLLLAASYILLPGTAHAVADVHSEIVTAATHAGLAAKATTVTMVHTHLHHALNCLVGPKGKGFDAKQDNPCAKTGDGAVQDTTSAAQKKALLAVVAEAERGIKTTDLAGSQRIAADVSTMLKTIN